MEAILELLLKTLTQRFWQAGFDVPQSMTEKGRESFVIQTLESAAILQQDLLDRFLAAARAVVDAWERGDLAAGVSELSGVVRETTRCLRVEPLRQQVFIVCQGGLVQEVVGLADDAYEICDCDAFEGPDEREGEKYFDGLSDAMKEYLRSTGWNKELPQSRRASRSTL